MKSDYEIAKKLLNQSLEKQPNLMQAYRNLINIEMNNSGAIAAENDRLIAEKALTYKKNNYIIWHVFLYSQLPRWGGSYDVMNQTLKNAKDSFPANDPLYNMLSGMVATDIVDLKIRREEYDAAGDIITSNERTRYPRLYIKKTQLYKEIKNYRKCLSAALYTLEYYPYERNTLNNKGVCADKLEQWADARDGFYRYTLVKGRRAWQLFYLGKAYMNLGEFDKAYASFKGAEALKPDYIKWTDRYVAYIEKTHRDKTNLTLPLVSD